MFGKRSTADDSAPRRVAPPQEVAAVAARSAEPKVTVVEPRAPARA